MSDVLQGIVASIGGVPQSTAARGATGKGLASFEDRLSQTTNPLAGVLAHGGITPFQMQPENKNPPVLTSAAIPTVSQVGDPNGLLVSTGGDVQTLSEMLQQGTSVHSNLLSSPQNRPSFENGMWELLAHKQGRGLLNQALPSQSANVSDKLNQAVATASSLDINPISLDGGATDLLNNSLSHDQNQNALLEQNNAQSFPLANPIVNQQTSQNSTAGTILQASGGVLPLLHDNGAAKTQVNEKQNLLARLNAAQTNLKSNTLNANTDSSTEALATKSANNVESIFNRMNLANHEGGKKESKFQNPSDISSQSTFNMIHHIQPNALSDNAEKSNLIQLPTSQDQMVEQIGLTVASKAKDGTQHIKIQLHPADLGRVDIQLNFTKDGLSHVTIVADKKDTLDLLQKDVKNLETALVGAGVKTDSGNLSFDFKQQHSQRMMDFAQQQSDSQSNHQGFSRNEYLSALKDDSSYEDANIQPIQYHYLNMRHGVDISV
ncbi:MAG: flagellar hook-length control protein FliK [Alphaproteobacteria bacterium]|nr:flagellar hook-length control protein FliK [Alphaproteobacteria bacterium]